MYYIFYNIFYKTASVFVSEHEAEAVTGALCLILPFIIGILGMSIIFENI